MITAFQTGSEIFLDSFQKRYLVPVCNSSGGAFNRRPLGKHRVVWRNSASFLYVNVLQSPILTLFRLLVLAVQDIFSLKTTLSLKLFKQLKQIVLNFFHELEEIIQTNFLIKVISLPFGISNDSLLNIYLTIILITLNFKAPKEFMQFNCTSQL